jgi:hypothetical protein
MIAQEDGSGAAELQASVRGETPASPAGPIQLSECGLILIRGFKQAVLQRDQRHFQAVRSA